MDDFDMRDKWVMSFCVVFLRNGGIVSHNGATARRIVSRNGATARRIFSRNGATALRFYTSNVAPLRRCVKLFTFLAFSLFPDKSK